MTNLEDLNLSFFRRYKFRLSEFDLLEKRDKFRASEFVSNEKRKLNNIKQANYFYCLWLPINTMLGGGDQNNRLGMESPLGLMLLRSKLFLLSLAPHQYNVKGR